jgi:hypothetical protein
MEKAHDQWTAHAEVVLRDRVQRMVCAAKTEVRSLVDKALFKRQQKILGRQLMMRAGTKDATSPIQWLFGWGEILPVIGRHNNDTERRRIRRLNGQFDGPIILPKIRGKHPKADRSKLLEWWRQLENEFEIQQATTQSQTERQSGARGDRVYEGKIGFGQVKDNQRSTGHLKRTR